VGLIDMDIAFVGSRVRSEKEVGVRVKRARALFWW